METFTIIYKDKSTSARIGILNTKKGKIETPFFMPVATKAAAKHLDSKQLEELGARAVISNAMILHFRPGDKVIKKLGGIGEFMNFSGINVTDSGGFQMYSDSIYLSSNEEGILFRNPFSGEKILMTPEMNMGIQLNIGSEIAMCLDSMPLYNKSKEDIEKAVKHTILWAKRCKQTHDKLQENLPKEKRQLLFGISQGGIYKDLRKACATELLKEDFDGYAIGGIALPEFAYKGEMEKAKKLEHNAIIIHKKVIPKDKPVYVMGEGDPIWMLEAISLGVDMFDSRMPTQSARRGTLFSSKGRVKILNKKYETDKKPIDEKCNCFVCKNYSRAYIKFLLSQEEAVGKELASYHNLYYLNDLIEQAKEQIKKGTFKEFKEKIKKVYSI